jgi:hypothetical protein
MKYLYLITFIGLSNFSSAQTFLNGSFETNTANDCIYNIDNESFDSYFSNIKGIGDFQALDILYDGACDEYGLAQEGNYFSTLENSLGVSTAMSFELSGNILIGDNFSFCFYFRGVYAPVQIGPIEIGLSDNDSTFGALVYTSTTANLEWQNQIVTFQAPITGNYITVRYKNSTNYNGILIDNFRICNGLGIEGPKATETSYRIYPNPTTENLNIAIINDLPSATSLRIYNQLGQKLFESAYSQVISVASLPAGIYILELSTNEQVTSYKFIKQ